ncbi:CRE-ABTS-4 protein [Caenorhabditis remanei]|uniref:CRE-ABTS-4 protein n=1 Tax=Caenorhabditis remanei TaxID=31234 RepID=E3LDC4_CAERE|nr:CRE-ABTS-4 protein [Caenorhabditis remanei]
MSNGSPGRHSNKAFSIGSDDIEESETSFISPHSSDLLRNLLNDSSEQTPLILQQIREESEDTVGSLQPSTQRSSSASSTSEERLPSSIDVFTVNDFDGSWKPASRFARYESDAEGFDNHLGMAHVPCLPMGTYQALQKITSKTIIHRHVMVGGSEHFLKYIETNVVDSDFPTLGQAIVKIVKDRAETLENKKKVNKKHSASTQSLNSDHLLPRPGKIPRNLISEPNNLSRMDKQPLKRLPTSKSGVRIGTSYVKDPPQTFCEPHYDNSIEYSMLIAGAVPDATVCRLVALRFDEAAEMKDIFPGTKKIRTIYFLIGPDLTEHSYLDLGRAFASVVSNPVSNSIFDTLKSPELITKAVDRFLADTVVIAPGKIVSRNNISGEFIRRVVNMNCEKRERNTTLSVVHPSDLDVERNSRGDEDKINSCCSLFAGVKSDLANRYRYYLSDITDGFRFTILTVVVYMFCVTVVPTLTFGAILAMGTSGLLSVKKCLLSQGLSGIVWSLFSCQPLLVMSPTGPFLVFEKALFKCSIAFGLDFLEVRLYTGIFVFLITIIGASTNCARFIKHVTIYTEDIFCALISIIFFSEVCEFLLHQLELNPIDNLDYYLHNSANCTGLGLPDECRLSNPNTFLIQAFMLLISVAIFHYLRQIGLSDFFGRTFRNLCNNFGGIFAVIFVSIMYQLLFANIDVSVSSENQNISQLLQFVFQMVNVAENLAENKVKIGWIVIPTTPPTLSTLAGSFAAACLVYVLIFVETEIPEQMALRSKRKLKKGGGLHWDLIVVGFCTLVSSITGLPWMCPAAVQSLAHIDACTETEKTNPGEPKIIKGVIEQRLSGMITYIMLLLFAFYGHIVSIPSAAIFGVFFYLGVRNLEGSRLIMRVFLFFLVPKRRGDHKFLEMAPFAIINGYTLIQCSFVAIMYAAKTHEILGVFFPIFIVITTWFVAKFLPLIFSDELLAALDGEDEEKEDEENSEDFYLNSRIPV